MSNVRFDDYYALISHPVEPSLLLLQGEGGWTLPKATVPLSPDDGRWRDAFRVNTAFHRLLGINLTMLECLYVSPFPDVGSHGSSVFVMSNHDEEWVLPLQATWISYDRLATLAFAIPEHRTLLQQWQAKRTSLVSNERLWTHDGWFEEASTWILSQLRRQGIAATGPIEQFRSWFISSLLRVPTTIGEVYFKVVPVTDVHEPLLTQMLANQYPTLAPPVLAVHEEQRWLLMKAVPGQKMPSNANPFDYVARWKTLVQLYARMQRDYTQHTEHLLAIGCHDWRLEQLIEYIDPFFAELPSLLSGAWNPLTQEERQALQAAIPRLKTFCRELMQLGIPATLHHGDFHRGNIIINEESCTLLDWSGFVGVTHPFLSLWLPLSDWSQDLQAQLCESYLEVWSDIAPREQLHAAVMKANPLAELCGALGHRYQIAHAQTALLWDILNEQEHLLECLRNVLVLIGKI